MCRHCAQENSHCLSRELVASSFICYIAVVYASDIASWCMLQGKPQNSSYEKKMRGSTIPARE